MINQLFELRKQYENKQITKEDFISKMYKVHSVLWQYQEYIKKTKAKSIEITNENIYLTTLNGIKMLCDRNDERLVPIEILNFGDYESEEIKMMRKFVNKKSIILDIGANIGWYSLNLSSGVKKIYAFEPIKKTFEYLKQNLVFNNIENVEIFNFGFSEKNETLDFYYDPKLSGSTSLKNLHENRKKIKIKCKVKRLDDFIAKLNTKIDLIKCDVEGAELFVIKGAINMLKKEKPVIFLEMLRKWSAKFGYHPNDIIKVLKEIGYNCYYVRGMKLVEIKAVTDKTIATNYYFLDSKKHSKYLR